MNPGRMLRPELVVRWYDLPETARELARIISRSGAVFDRGGPCKVVLSADGGPPQAVPLSVQGVVKEAHWLARPVKLNSEGEARAITLPERVAKLYLDPCDWGLPPLKGITTAPLLYPDGTIYSAEGYDQQSGLWCASVPAVSVPDQVSEEQARAALHLIRSTFRTFPFADALMAPQKGDAPLGPDLSVPPAHDESALLAGLVVCRRCGVRMGVHYQHSHGRPTPFTYDCVAGNNCYGEPRCQHMAGPCLDDFVTAQVLAALVPATLELSLSAAEQVEQERATLTRLWEQRRERAAYEVDRVARQYYAVEPENRLVARTLERA